MRVFGELICVLGNAQQYSIIILLLLLLCILWRVQCMGFGGCSLGGWSVGGCYSLLVS